MILHRCHTGQFLVAVDSATNRPRPVFARQSHDVNVAQARHPDDESAESCDVVETALNLARQARDAGLNFPDVSVLHKIVRWGDWRRQTVVIYLLAANISWPQAYAMEPDVTIEEARTLAAGYQSLMR